jgi:DNA repair protein RecN (Recombination protein N)
MLNYISIKNIVLIEKLELNFRDGFTVLTGETGAGKSIVIDAINLILGKRAEKRLIRKGQDEATVSAVFSVSKNQELKKLILGKGLNIDNELILRRNILSNGRSQSFLNDESISLNLMKEISNFLIEVHGQNDQAGLLDNSNHINILDDWGKLLNLKKKLSKSYHLFKEKVRLHNEYKEKIGISESKKNHLSEDLDEITKLEYKDNEINNLILNKNYLTSIEKIKDSMSKINYFLQGDSNTRGVYENLSLAKKQIFSILPFNHDKFKELDESLEKTIIEYKETEAILEESFNSIDETNLSLDDIESRISLIRRVSRKHNVEENKINSLKIKFQDDLNNLFNSEKDLKAVEDEVVILKAEYKERATKLSFLRKEVTKKLSKAVNKEFPILKLDNAKFGVSVDLLEEFNWKADGIDIINFKIETNKNSGYESIEKIASGGELSRIMLAIKVSLVSDNKNNYIKTLIFDEVDTGVGGAVADAVGKRLELLGKNNQVLAVTHHPQVAAMAKHHFKVNKNNLNSYSTTSISNLNYEERLEEVARMLSGEKTTNAARKAAESLFVHNKNL